MLCEAAGHQMMAKQRERVSQQVMQTFLLPLSFFLLGSGVALEDPPLVAELRAMARNLPSPEDLSGPAGFELLREYEEAGRPQAYISGWKEGRALNDALARAAAIRGLTSTAAELAKLAGKSFPPLPASLAEPPEKGKTLALLPGYGLLLAWPFDSAHIQGRRILGAPLDMLRPAEGDVISGRVFRLLRTNAEEYIDLGDLLNPWGDSGAVASFAVYTPREVDIGLKLEGRGRARILSGAGKMKGWRMVLIHVEPHERGPLDAQGLWTMSVSLAEDIPGHFYQGTPESFGDELAGYLSWCADGGKEAGQAGSVVPAPRTSVVEESLAQALLLNPGAPPLKPEEGSAPWMKRFIEALEKAGQGQITKARKLLLGIRSEPGIAPGIHGILSKFTEVLAAHGDKGGAFRWNPEEDGLQGTLAGRAAWGRAWMAKGYKRPVSARGRKGEDLSLIADGRMDTSVPLNKGETWVVLDMGELTAPVSTAIFLDRPALVSAVVEGSKDGGHYALLGEFKDLKGRKTLELAADQGGNYRMLRLILTSESDSAVLREVLVNYNPAVPSP